MKFIKNNWFVILGYVLAIVYILSFTNKVSTATQYYVSTTGNDSNSGTIGSPFRTILHCTLQEFAGDVCNVRAGSYKERVVISDTTHHFGDSWDNPITLQAYNGETVHWTAGGFGDFASVLGFDHSGVDSFYWQFIGFDLHGDGNSDGSVTLGAVMDGGGDHIRVQNSELRLTFRSCYNGVGVDFQLLNDHVHNCGDGNLSTPDHGIYWFGQQLLVDGGEYDHNSSYGVQIFGSGHNDVDDNVIRNAKFHDNYYGMHMNSGGGGSAILATGHRNQFYNNLSYDEPLSGLDFNYRCTDCAAYNNTFYNIVFGAINIATEGCCGPVVGTIVKNNIVYMAGSNISDGGVDSVISNNFIGDPLFTNVSGHDFTLSSSMSGAIGYGANLFSLGIAGLDYDFVGHSRPIMAAWTAGAYNFIGSGTPMICGVDPLIGYKGTTFDIDITGCSTNFVNMTSVGSVSGSGVTVNSTTVTSATSAVLNVTISYGAATGLRTITMTTGGEVAVGTNSFMVMTVSIPSTSDEFVGPFPSWYNIKSDFGAVGNGSTNDTTAIQNGLDAISSGSGPLCLWFPSGTYKITLTLTISHAANLCMIGEDPTTTTIIWAGSMGGTMIDLNGVAYSKFDRFTWNGASIAGIAVDQSWDGTGSYFDTGNEYTDNIFEDVGYGIHCGFLGYGCAETSVERTQFLRNTDAGIAMGNFNALDMWVWYSRFEDCQYAITNVLGSGAGNFHAFNNVILRSTEGDFYVGPTSNFSLRNNYSNGSWIFLIAPGSTANPAPFDIVGNTIIDPQSGFAIIYQSNEGPALIMDNKVRTTLANDGKIVFWKFFSPIDVSSVVAVGNTWGSFNPMVITPADNLRTDGPTVDLNNVMVDNSTIDATEPTLPSFLPNYNRTIYEVSLGSSATTIQTTIDLACSENIGKRPVVHFQYGNFNINHNITIASPCDVQLVGDMMGDVRKSSLTWTGGVPGPVIQLSGPSKVTIRNLYITGSGLVDGVGMGDVDQVGGRVYGDNLQLHTATVNNLFSNGIDNLYTQLENFTTFDSKSSIVGGVSLSSGGSTLGKVNIFSSITCCAGLLYDVSGGAKTLLRDVWFESSPSPGGYAYVHGRATFTMDGARIAAGGASPSIDVQGLYGSVSVTTTDLDYKLSITGDGTNSNFMGLGNMYEFTSAPFFINTSSPAATFALNTSRLKVNPIVDHYSDPVSNTGSSDTSFILNMLNQTRINNPEVLTSLPTGVSDVRLFSVWVYGSVNNVIISGDGVVSNGGGHYRIRR